MSLSPPSVPTHRHPHTQRAAESPQAERSTGSCLGPAIPGLSPAPPPACPPARVPVAETSPQTAVPARPKEPPHMGSRVQGVPVAFAKPAKCEAVKACVQRPFSHTEGNAPQPSAPHWAPEKCWPGWGRASPRDLGERGRRQDIDPCRRQKGFVAGKAGPQHCPRREGGRGASGRLCAANARGSQEPSTFCAWRRG